MEKKVISREELYEMVWSKPLIRLATEYNISDNGIRKICKRMDIPLPDSGYWSKLKYHKPVKKKKLPVNYSGENEIRLTEKNINNPENGSPNSAKKALIKSYEKLDSIYFTVSNRLSSPDSLIINSQKILLDKDSQLYGNGPVRSRYSCLNISVFPHSMSRAFRLFDAIIKLLRYRNYDFEFRHNETYVMVNGVDVSISLREKQRFEIVKEGNWETRKSFSTGILIFRVYCIGDREFYDNKIKLEEKLPDILAEIEYKAAELNRIWEENRIRRQIEDDKLRLEKEIKERKELEIKNVKLLIKESYMWHQSTILYDYIKTIEQNAIANNTLTDELKNWLYWARQKADWFNPFIKKEDDILTNEDRLII